MVHLFGNPLIVILLVASFVSAAVGEWARTTIIFRMVVLGVAIVFVQTHRSQQAVERLRSSVAPTATVLRDGNWIELPRREVVPGDFITSRGGRPCSPGCVIESEHLHLQESALTGESVPVEKKARARERVTLL